MIDGAVLGDDAFAAEVLAPLRALRPEFDTVARVPAASLVRLHLDPEGPTPAYASSTLVSGLPDAAIAAIVEAVGPGSGTRLAVAELRQLGGALGRRIPTAARCRPRRRFLALGLGLGGGRDDWARSGRTPPASSPRSSRGRPAGSTCRCSTTAPTPGRSSRPACTRGCPPSAAPSTRAASSSRRTTSPT